MTRLQSELNRLYLPPPQAHSEDDAQSSAPINSSGRVRALVIEMTRPPSWEVLSRIWRGVQAELELPAPAIAVSGTEGLQLWFSLAEPIAVSQAHAFLDGLRVRFVPDIEPDRFRLMPAGRVPARQETTGNWSAFVAPDLAPVFGDTPWLDIPPNEEGQAALLRGLAMVDRLAFEAAVKRLGPSAEARVTPVTPITQAQPLAVLADEDPRRFLLRVMNDDSVALALRIEAAKALLQPGG